MPRFVPLGEIPQMGDGLTSTMGESPRFVPLGGSGGLSASDLFNQFQGLGQPASMGQQIARGAGMLGSGLGAVNQAGSLFGASNPIPPGLGQGLGLAGGALGLGSNIYGLTQGNYAAIPGTITGALGLAGTTGAMMGGTAAGGLAAGLSTAGAVGGTLALPLAGVGIGLSNMMKKQAKKAQQQTTESADIRRGLLEAVPNVRQAMYVAQNLGQVNALSPEEQIAALQQARQHLEKGVEDLSVDFSRFISTGGQGGRASMVGKVPTGDAEALAAAAWPDIIIGLARVQDALAQRGVILPASEVGPLTNRSPVALLNFAKNFAGAPAGYDPYDTLTPEMLAQVGPGNVEQFLAQTFGQMNPQLAESVMGQRYATLPTITRPEGADRALEAVMPKYLADQQRVLEAEWLGTYGPSAMNPGVAAGNVHRLTPYTPGGAAALQARLPEIEARMQRDFAERQAASMTGGN